MTGPRRRTYLARTTRLQARTPMPPRSKPMARSSLRSVPVPSKTAAARKGRATGTATGQPKPPREFTPKVKLAIRTRAGGGDPARARCEAHGDFLGEHGGEFQHRQARGMGGSRSAVKNSAANGTLICSEAHRVCESRDRDMQAQGFWLEQWQDPRTEPIMLHGGQSGVTLWLAEDGVGPDGDGYLRQPPALGRAA